MNKADMERLFAYTRWANLKTLDAVEKLDHEQLFRDMGNSFPSVFKTLEHTFFAEWVWLKRLNDMSPKVMFEGHEFRSLSELRDWWEINDLQWQALIESMDEGALERRITYYNMAGDQYTVVQQNIMQHVVNHSTYHRGQITTMIRQLGGEAVTTDMIFYTG